MILGVIKSLKIIYKLYIVIIYYNDVDKKLMKKKKISDRVIDLRIWLIWDF